MKTEDTAAYRETQRLSDEFYRLFFEEYEELAINNRFCAIATILSFALIKHSDDPIATLDVFAGHVKKIIQTSRTEMGELYNQVASITETLKN
jgi:hypothetical protein